MHEVWWLVSCAAGDYDDSGDLTLVEFRESWADAKKRFAELFASGNHVDLFDADGELVREGDAGGVVEIGRMSAPRRAGWYSWNECTGHVLIENAPPQGWRGGVERHNAVTKGIPSGRQHGGPEPANS